MAHKGVISVCFTAIIFVGILSVVAAASSALETRKTISTDSLADFASILNRESQRAEDDQYWRAISCFSSLGVSSIVRFNGNLVMAGSFTRIGCVETGPLASFDGTNWSAMGLGIRRYRDYGSIDDMIIYNNHLIVAGIFDSTNGVVAHNIAAWNGTEWNQMQGGIQGSINDTEVNCLGIFKGRLVVGGKFLSAGPVAARHIATWDGFNWQNLGAGIAYHYVNDVVEYQGKLAVAGWFLQAGGITCNAVACWNDSTWEPLGSGLKNAFGGFGSGAAIEVFNSQLYVGGGFVTAGDLAANNIAVWNGTSWQALGTGLNGGCSDLEVFDSRLYVGGRFNQVDSLQASGITSWNGSMWNPISNYEGDAVARILEIDSILLIVDDYPSVEVYSFDGNTFSEFLKASGISNSVNALAEDNGVLFVGGDFTLSDYTYLATWNGMSWIPTADAPNDRISAFANFEGQLLVGGEFTLIGAEQADKLAVYNDGAFQGFQPIGPWGSNAAVYDMKEFDGGLAVVGNGILSVAYFKDNSWSTLGAVPSGVFEAIEVYEGELICGGSYSFKVDDLVDDETGLMRWNGSEFVTLGGFVDGDVSDLLVFGGDLIVGGSFESVGSVEALNIARWDGSSWHPMGDGFESGVSTLAEIDGVLYAGGWSAYSGTALVNGIAYWDGQDWWPLGSGLSYGSGFSGGVRTILDFQGKTYVGGDFDKAGSGPAAYIAEWRKRSLRFSPTNLVFGAKAGTRLDEPKWVKVTGTTDEYWQAESFGQWFSIHPTSGYFPDSIRITRTASGLSEGVYNGQLRVTSSHTYNPTAKVELTLHVDPSVDVDDQVTPLGGSGSFNVYISHDSLAGFFIPLSYAEAESLLSPRFPSGIRVDSVNISPFYLDYGTTVEIDSLNKHLRFVNHPTQDPPIPKPDTANVMVLARVFYTVNASASAQVVVIDTVRTTCPPFDNSTSCSIKYYLPDGTVTVPNFDPGYIIIGDASTPTQQPAVLRASPERLAVRFNSCLQESTLSVVLFSVGSNELNFTATSLHDLVQLSPVAGTSPANLLVTVHAPDCDWYGTVYDTIIVTSESVFGDIRIPIEFGTLASCGDLDASGFANIADVVFLVNYIFSGGPAPRDTSRGDVNGNGSTDIADAVYLVNYIFVGGPPPCD